MSQPERKPLRLVAHTAEALSADHGSRLCDPLDAAWLQAKK